MSKRTLLFAGTFDPFHHGHLCVLLTAVNNTEYDNIEIVIHNYKYRDHKRMFTPEFIKELITDYLKEYKPNLLDKVTIDISNEESFYELLKSKEYVTDILFGGDSYNTIENWINYNKLKELLKKKNIIIIRRNNEQIKRIFGNEKILEYKCPEINDEFKYFYSGTLIRNRIKEKLIKAPRYITLPEVALSAVIAVVKTLDMEEYILIKHRLTGKLALPGGFLDKKDIFKTLYKELKEEIGLDYNNIKEIKRLDCFIEDNNVLVQPFYIATYKTYIGKPTDIEEVEDIVFRKYEDLKPEDMRFVSHYKLIQQVEEKFFKGGVSYV